jgi:hypothetical protein
MASVSAGRQCTSPPKSTSATLERPQLDAAVLQYCIENDSRCSVEESYSRAPGTVIRFRRKRRQPGPARSDRYAQALDQQFGNCCSRSVVTHGGFASAHVPRLIRCRIISLTRSSAAFR